MEYIIILTNFSNRENARKVAKLLLDNHLAACINIVNGVESFYRWKGKIVQDNEFSVFIKTRASNFEKVKELIIKNHEYELPEVISIKIEDGLKPYLDWIYKNTNE